MKWPQRYLAVVQNLSDGIAGSFIKQRCPQTVVMVLVAHHCILRTSNFSICDPPTAPYLTAAYCSSFGIQRSVKDKWLVPRLRRVIRDSPRGKLLLGVTPRKFRDCWTVARKRILLPGNFTPYSLRRGGATCLFQHSGSYSKVAERGRWSTEKAMRMYVNQALADLATDSASIAWAGKLGLPKLLHLLST